MIMGHCHLFPGGLEEKRDEFGVPAAAEHLDGLLGACGFGQAQVLAPFEEPRQQGVRSRVPRGRSALEWLLSQPHVGVEEDARLLATATICPDEPAAVEKLRRARSLGVRLLKIHPLVMHVDLLRPDCEPFFRAAEDARMPTIVHTGGGPWDWPAEYASPDLCARLAERFPGLPILMAHCGTFGGADGFQASLAACRMHANLYLDATGALHSAGHDAWRRALDCVGPQRVSTATTTRGCPAKRSAATSSSSTRSTRRRPSARGYSVRTSRDSGRPPPHDVATGDNARPPAAEC